MDLSPTARFLPLQRFLKAAGAERRAPLCLGPSDKKSESGLFWQPPPLGGRQRHGAGVLQLRALPGGLQLRLVRAHPFLFFSSFF